MGTTYEYPCKACAERHLGCHDRCEKYLEAKKIHEEKIRADRLKNGKNVWARVFER